MVGPHGPSTNHASNEDPMVEKRERDARKITCASVVENPDIVHENARQRLMDCT
jgi:hypothetical protein